MTGPVDFKTLTRTGKPNDYLLAPDGLCEAATPDGGSPAFSEAPSALFKRMTSLVAAGKGVTQLAVDEERFTLSYVAVTPLLRFKDDVTLKVLPKGEGAQVAAYSASRVGYSDLGTNKKRVDGLIAALS